MKLVGSADGVTFFVSGAGDCAGLQPLRIAANENVSAEARKRFGFIVGLIVVKSKFPR